MDGSEHEQEQGGPSLDEALLQRAFPEVVDAARQRPPEPGEGASGQPEEREAEPEQPSPRIYMASLSDYNAGRLHGRWVEADQPLDDLWSEVGDMLAESPEPGAEEWAIHDYEGFGPLELHEYESLEFVQQAAEGIAEHGEAFAAFVAGVADRDPDRFAFFDEMYKGRWESVEDYARHVMEQEGVSAVLEQLPEWVRSHIAIDYDALVAELQAGSVITMEANDGGVHVFDFE